MVQNPLNLRVPSGVRSVTVIVFSPRLAVHAALAGIVDGRAPIRRRSMVALFSWISVRDKLKQSPRAYFTTTRAELLAVLTGI